MTAKLSKIPFKHLKKGVDLYTILDEVHYSNYCCSVCDLRLETSSPYFYKNELENKPLLHKDMDDVYSGLKLQRYVYLVCSFSCRTKFLLTPALYANKDN